MALFFVHTGCSPSAYSSAAKKNFTPSLPFNSEVQEEFDRPSITTISREGDPAKAIAIQVYLGENEENTSLRSIALSALLSARLERDGFLGVQSVLGQRWLRIRALSLHDGEKIAHALDRIVREKVSSKENYSVFIQKELRKYTQWPIEQDKQSASSRCFDVPRRTNSIVPVDINQNDWLEYARASLTAHNLKLGVVANESTVQALLETWQSLEPLFDNEKQERTRERSIHTPSFNVHRWSQPHVGATWVVEGLPRASLLKTIDFLRTTLHQRWSSMYGWRVRSIQGVAYPEGGCMVIEAESSRAIDKNVRPLQSLTQVASISEILREETARLIKGLPIDINETKQMAIATGGDPREVADRAVWWSWKEPNTSKKQNSLDFSINSTVFVPPDVIQKIGSRKRLQQLFEKISTGTIHSSTQPWIEKRVHVETGQGELWALLASPCGLMFETKEDAGIAALAMQTLVHAHHASNTQEISIEPWVDSMGVGLIAHAPSRHNESSDTLARRVGDTLGRVFFTPFVTEEAVAYTRAETISQQRKASNFSEWIQSALIAVQPTHPSWFAPKGTLEGVAHASASSINLRLASLRTSALRLAVIANHEANQASKVHEALSRWSSSSLHTIQKCPSLTKEDSDFVKAPILVNMSSTLSGVSWVFSVSPSMRAAARWWAIALRGNSGLLAKRLNTTGLVRFFDAQWIPGVGQDALIVTALMPEENRDVLVLRMREFFSRLPIETLGEKELQRIQNEAKSERLFNKLEPHNRLISLFTGEGEPFKIDAHSAYLKAKEIFREENSRLVISKKPDH